MKRHTGSVRRPIIGAVTIALAAPAAVLAFTSTAEATPVARQIRVADTDWTSGGVGGIGQASTGGGTGTISISGVSGPVTGAYLVWHGIGPFDGSQSVGTYTNPNITVNGAPVTGNSQGESGSNCWGDNGTARTYLANVTDIVQAQGDGDYALAGLGDGGDANGADLVVTYDDGDATNNRDLYLYYGNDTDADGFPGEDLVWDDPLTDLNYQGGVANLQLGVADGQDFGNPDDGTLDVSGDGGTVSFADNAPDNFLWDGTTVPDAGHSRAGNGSLFDLETFDVTGALGAAGTQDLQIDSALENDCHALVMAAVDLPATGDQPPAPATVSVSPASTTEGTAPAKGHQYSKLDFKVTLSSRQSTPTSVSLMTQDGTAFSGSDYLAKTKNFVIPAGGKTKTFTVKVVRDAAPEGDEYLYAVIESASVTVATDAAIGTILDDDSMATALHGQALRNATRQATGGGLG